MPFAGPPGPPPTFLEELVPLLHAGFHSAGGTVAELVTLPGQVLVSFLLVALAAWRLRDWARPTMWLLAVAVEVGCKDVLTRPALHRGGAHVVAFDASWPSGHALRCALVAAALAAAWPRLRPLLVAWLAAAVVLLVLAGFHTPTDVVGGLLLATVFEAGSGLLGRPALRRAPA